MDNLVKEQKTHVILDDTISDLWPLASLTEKFLVASFMLLMILRPGFKEAYFEFVKSVK